MAPATADGLIEDFALFCDDRGIPLFDWQRDVSADALHRVDGHFRYRLVGISVSRGSGKSALGAKIATWVLMRKVRQTVVSAALGLDSAAIVMEYGKELFRPLGDKARVLADTILVPAIHGQWVIVSREHTSSRGLHPDLIVYDECGWAKDDELFASLLSAQASVADPLMIVISTVGKSKSGPLWRIKELAEAGDPSVYWFHSSENLSPLVTPEFLARQKRILLPLQYAREHENRWVDAADSFVSAADVDAAMGYGWTEQLMGEPGTRYQHFWDIGVVHDATVGCAGHVDDEGIAYIDRIITLQGSREAPVQLATVRGAMRQLAVAFPPDLIRVESWQGIQVAQELTADRWPVELFTPTAKTNSEEWPILSQRLVSRTLVLPPHARLREELLNLSYEVGPTGVKVTDRGQIHQDHAVAVRGVCASLTLPAYVPLRVW